MFKYCAEHKRKRDALDKATRKKVTGKGTSELGGPQKVRNAELINKTWQISIPDSVAQERRQNEVIRMLKTLDRLTEELNHEGFNLNRTFRYLH